jgi:hypothetical protein
MAMLPTPLARKATPRTAAARSLAPRVLDVRWVVTAATPANATPAAASAGARVAAPGAPDGRVVVWPPIADPLARRPAGHDHHAVSRATR